MEKIALTLIQQYMAGWKQNDLSKIINSLTQDCLIIESHGPSYHGINEVICWFKLWLKANSIVLRWDVQTFYYLAQQKISFIHEYRMTHAAYHWSGTELKLV